jgi:hypothetical protein
MVRIILEALRTAVNFRALFAPKETDLEAMREEIGTRVAARFSRGNVRIQVGHFMTEAALERRRAALRRRLMSR